MRVSEHKKHILMNIFCGFCNYYYIFFFVKLHATKKILEVRAHKGGHPWERGTEV